MPGALWWTVPPQHAIQQTALLEPAATAIGVEALAAEMTCELG